MRAVHLLLAALVCLVTPAAAQEADRTVTGEITGTDHQTYREIPFDVPAGVERITVRLTYDKANRTVVDLGVFDPERFRGWSGGTRDRFTLAPSDATPGYLPGALPPGRWHVQFGVPNARKDSHSAFRVEIFFDRGDTRNASAAIADAPVRSGPGWYRGDLHMHDAHSDGSCASQQGKRVPCPLYRTVAAAADAGLDFIAVTDHNTSSHFSALRELQPYYDRLLLIPGAEITTFGGHANIFGQSRWVDFRVGSANVPDIAALQRNVAAADAILSVNHPALPSGEACMGCGWVWPGTDWRQVTAIEAINSLTTQPPLAGLDFWYDKLNRGYRITGIGSSDNHDPAAGPGKAPIGRPATVVHARELSQPAILDGIRAGNVFIDVEGTRDRMLEVAVVAGKTRAAMGETIAAPAARLEVEVRVTGVAQGIVQLIANGKEHSRLPLGTSPAALPIDRAAACGWVAVNVLGPNDRKLLIGNPVYIQCKAAPRR
ncbi:CehA/McbA family metallohydrolase [Sphingomonas sp. BT-65]|uniref:CehA/McbA family metallohydrolase n=1 Tax=Sphingomonas sp. BT-65 TaxID=2989821 RepID=UPI002235F6CE|nr:CehA/McbA family metallohydrolase [Sphingomonas sp. BT-65]MCW4463103.1 CehA/McbA family metallohydrolase [Sphingomonas sp. BT-65]